MGGKAGGKTEVTLHEVVVKAAPGMEGALAGMEAGWNGSLDKLSHELGYLKPGPPATRAKHTVALGTQDFVLAHLWMRRPRSFSKPIPTQN